MGGNHGTHWVIFKRKSLIFMSILSLTEMYTEDCQWCHKDPYIIDGPHCKDLWDIINSLSFLHFFLLLICTLRTVNDVPKILTMWTVNGKKTPWKDPSKPPKTLWDIIDGPQCTIYAGNLWYKGSKNRSRFICWKEHSYHQTPVISRNISTYITTMKILLKLY